MKSVHEFADILIERCTWLLDLSDVTFSHVREIETIIDQVQHLITAVSCNENDLSLQLSKCRQVIENIYNSPIPLKEQEESIESTVKKELKIDIILFIY